MTAKDLKNALLQEAVQGKLVPQIASEGNASDLLEEIRKEKTKLVKEGKIKKEKHLPEITEEEIPFEIPENWCWCRIKDIAYVSTGMTPLKSESKFYENGNIPWVTSTLTSSDYIDKADTYITEFALNNTSLDLYPKHTLILAMYGQGKTRGQISELLIPATINQACAAIELFLNEETLRKYMKLFHNWNYNNLRKEAAGSAQPNLNLNIIQNTIFPLPPLAEQKRIVAAIEKFMPLIEEYGKKETELKAFNGQIGTLTKKAILQEAVQGKLVPQISAEGNAKDLNEKLRKTKKILVEEKQIYKKTETAPFYDVDDYPFDIPDNWTWVKLSDISIIQEGAGIRKWQYRNTGTQLLCVTNILNGKVDLNLKKLYIDTAEYNSKYKHLTVKKGDIVCSCSGGSWGKAAIYDLDETIMMNTSTLRLRFFEDLGDNLYLYYVVQSDFFKNQLLGQLSGMQPNFGYAHYSRICIPLPPLAEQKRIVFAIEKMLPLCEKLGV